MSAIVYGARYVRDMRATEIAKCVRADIKAAVKSGTLPAATYSVRCSGSTLHNAIRVEVSSVAGLTVHNPKRITYDLDGRGDMPDDARIRYTAEAGELLASLHVILDAYNYDGSEPITDYYNVNFYGSVGYSHEYEMAERERQTSLASLPETSAQNDFCAWVGAT